MTSSEDVVVVVADVVCPAVADIHKHTQRERGKRAWKNKFDAMGKRETKFQKKLKRNAKKI